MELTLSPTEIEELRKLQCNLQGRSDYARVTCILMLSMGNTPIFVADCLGIDISTIYRYRSLYLEGGLDKLLENRYRGYQGLLNIF
ncbi:helix-turn-helix domain-containing protein [Capnocytophaga gingivalis]|uniref:helix-turn-helix domain-containing protein n=1 Tax=Capnocytophaga gingivalis TaxID=1017 RepID=UPI003C7921D8